MNLLVRVILVLCALLAVSMGPRAASAAAPCPAGWGSGGGLNGAGGPVEGERCSGEYSVAPRLVIVEDSNRFTYPVATVRYSVPGWCLDAGKPNFTLEVMDKAGGMLWTTTVSGEAGKFLAEAPVTGPGENEYLIRLGNSHCHAYQMVGVSVVVR